MGKEQSFPAVVRIPGPGGERATLSFSDNLTVWRGHSCPRSRCGASLRLEGRTSVPTCVFQLCHL